jgi:DNA polymerase
MQIDELKAEMLWCTKCNLHKNRINVVVGNGNEYADILFIGEAPGAEEDKEGIPFCGRSGKLLRELIKEANIQDNVYITNIVKCRPPENRDPAENEIRSCMPFLRKQIEQIKPKFIVGVGRISSKRIIPDFKITNDHGKFYTLKNGIRFMGIYHPAFVLRNQHLKNDLLNDLIKLRKKFTTTI